MRSLWWNVVLCSVTCSVDAADLPWWKTAIFYQVYPRSFKDSNGDGVGDLKGVEQMADYFTELGVDAIWLSPIFTSPMADFGYDISDFNAIDPVFGTMADFDSLLAKLHSINVKLVLDFVPNHSSDEHVWFNKSLNREPGYEDFYVWRNASGKDAAGNPLPPNNWISCFSGSAWQWREERSQFYLHKFVTKQPDLNYYDDNVKGNMTAVIEFWLDKGVDGFRMDAVQHIFENISYPDDPIISGNGSLYNDLDHVYDLNQQGTYDLLKYWADVVYQHVQKDGRPRAIFLEVYDSIPVSMKYYGSGNESLESPFNFQLLTSGSQAIRPMAVKEIIDSWMKAMPAENVANWVVGNHDQSRVANRYGPEMVDAVNLLTGVLPGIKVAYNGEEIGMHDTFIRWDQTVDPSGILLGPDNYLSASRDPQRTPMQWDASLSAGFSTNGKTWLPVNPNYWWLNVAAQRTAPASHFKVFQAMAKARKDPVLQLGDYSVIVQNNDTLAIVRSYNNASFVMLANMGSKELSYTSSNFFASNNLDVDMEVVVASVNSNLQPGTSLGGGQLAVSLRPKAAVLLKTKPGSSDAPTTPSTGTTAAPSSATTNCATAALLLVSLVCSISR